MKDWNIYCLARSLSFATSIEQWSNDNPHRLRVTRKVNPYELEDDHPACCLRLTARVVEKIVTGLKTDKSKAGVYLRKIWNKVMIRRTYASPDTGV
jgi:hypothetical protein